MSIPDSVRNAYLPPRPNEEEYFARQEAERGRLVANERNAVQQAEDREQARALHAMKCPKCGMDLTELTLHEIRIDQCLSCEGIWLDKGELDLIRKSEAGIVDKLLTLLR